MNTPTEGVPPVRLAAEALFCSDLQPSQKPGEDHIRRAVGAVLRRSTATGECLRQVAFAYSCDPAGAATRMRWCVAAVRAVYGFAPEGGRL